MTTLNELKKKLSDEIETAEWEWLKPHYQRDSIIIVDEDLDLIEVAACIGSNDLKRVADWMKLGRVRKPTLEQIETWTSAPTTPFLFVIVQPWVIIQPKAN